MIYDEQHNTYNQQGINFDSLSHLESIGLVHFQQLGFKFMKLPKLVLTSYYGETSILEMPNDADNEFQIGKVMLTKIGLQLAAISGSSPVAGFLNYARDVWREKGYKLFDLDDVQRKEKASGNSSDEQPAN